MQRNFKELGGFWSREKVHWTLADGKDFVVGQVFQRNFKELGGFWSWEGFPNDIERVWKNFEVGKDVSRRIKE